MRMVERIENNGVWFSENGIFYSVNENETEGEVGFLLSFHQGEMPCFKVERISAERIINEMKKIAPLKKWRNQGD